MMNRKLPLLFMLLLSGCLMVEDFGEAWDKGFSDRCITAIARDHYVEDEHKTKDDDALKAIVRSLKSGTHNFLMIKSKAGDKGGTFSRYMVKDGQFISYGIKEGMDAQFAKDYPNAPIILEGEGVTGKLAKAASLTPEVLKVVTAIADKSEYWTEANKTPYNPHHYAECKQ